METCCWLAFGLLQETLNVFVWRNSSLYESEAFNSPFRYLDNILNINTADSRYLELSYLK